MAEEICPGCDQPITPGEWITAVAVESAGLRAHLRCLETGLPDPPLATRPGELLGYCLARRTMSAAWLRPGARFVELTEESVVIAVFTEEAEAQAAILRTQGLGDGVR